jgi:hypothetical protein
MNKFIAKIEREKDFIKEGEVYPIESICHVEIYQHPFLFPLVTRVHGFLNLNYIVENVSPFEKTKLHGGNEVL